MSIQSPFQFRGLVTGVHDGDTFSVLLDQGLGRWDHGVHKAQDGVGIRFYGANARELGMPGGPEARDNLSALLPLNTEVTIISHCWDAYVGRLDCDVVLEDGTSLVPHLMQQQWLAGPYFGTGTKPVPPWPRTVA